MCTVCVQKNTINPVLHTLQYSYGKIKVGIFCAMLPYLQCTTLEIGLLSISVKIRVLNPQDVVDFHVKWKEGIHTAMIQYTKHLIKG